MGPEERPGTGCGYIYNPKVIILAIVPNRLLMFVVPRVPAVYHERDAARQERDAERAKCRALEQQLANMSLNRKRTSDVPIPAYHIPMSYTPG